MSGNWIVAGATGAAVIAGAIFLTATGSAGPPALSWVAAGDSYSAGVGLGSVTNDCDRDPSAYAPRALREILDGSYAITFDFVACSGARTSDVITTQLPAVSASDNVATLTIGGNDIGFATKVKGCAVGSCEADLMALRADVRGGTQTWEDLHTKLANTYVAIRDRMAASGWLYVLSYPIPFARQSASRCAGLNAAEQNAANALLTRLDDTIERAVRRANDELAASGRHGHVHFVDWRTGSRVPGGYTVPSGYPGGGQRFDTYVSPDGLCNTAGRNPFIHAYVVSTNAMNSFHPDTTGYGYGAAVLARAVRADIPDSPWFFGSHGR